MIHRLLLKDILRRIKQPTGFLVLMFLPLFFALLLGLIFGPRKNEESIIQVKLLIEDRDDSFASQFISGAFGRGELQNMFDVTAVDSGIGRPMMEEGKASALLIIPEGFGDSLLNRNSVSLSLIKNPSEAFGPKIAEETVSILAEGGDRLLWIGEKPLTFLKEQAESDEDLSEVQVALMAVQMHRLIDKAEQYLIPPRIKLIEESQDKSEKSNTSLMFASILAGIVVMTLFFTLELLSRDFFIEKEKHTLYRILISPAGIRSFVFAKMCFLFLAGYLSHGLVWLFGSLFFKIRLNMVQIFGLLTFSAIVLICLGGIMSLLYSMVRTREQAQSMAPAMIILFSMLGGTMIPRESLPRIIQKLAVVSPVYWGVDGMKKIVLSGVTLGEISVHILILSIIGLGSLLLSFSLYQRRLRP